MSLSRCLIKKHISPCCSEKHPLKSQCFGFTDYPTNEPQSSFILLFWLHFLCTLYGLAHKIITKCQRELTLRGGREPVQVKIGDPDPVLWGRHFLLILYQMEQHDFEMKQGSHLPGIKNMRRHNSYKGLRLRERKIIIQLTIIINTKNRHMNVISEILNNLTCKVLRLPRRLYKAPVLDILCILAVVIIPLIKITSLLLTVKTTYVQCKISTVLQIRSKLKDPNLKYQMCHWRGTAIGACFFQRDTWMRLRRNNCN